MAEWQVEEGIGEERAILLERGQAIAARLRWPGELTAGAVLEGRLVAVAKGSSRGRVVFPGGEEALADKLPRDASEGRTMRFEVRRAAVGEAARRKLAQVRPTDAPERPAPTLAEELGARVVRRFPAGLWEDLLDEARSGTLAFPGGSLHFNATPAMILVDVDGTGRPRELALAAVPHLARAIVRFGLAGSIGVDFPTLQAKDDRKAVDAALGVHLNEWDHERTAMNGFGFVQLVTRMEGPSLLHRLQFSPAASAARSLLRRAEGLEGAGTIQLAINPALDSFLGFEWIGELRRRTGREIDIRIEPGLAIEAPHAQLGQQ